MTRQDIKIWQVDIAIWQVVAEPRKINIVKNVSASEELFFLRGTYIFNDVFFFFFFTSPCDLLIEPRGCYLVDHPCEHRVKQWKLKHQNKSYLVNQINGTNSLLQDLFRNISVNCLLLHGRRHIGLFFENPEPDWAKGQ